MKNKIIVILFMMTLLFFMSGYFFQEHSVSKSERRPLTTWNEVNKYSFFDSYFSENLEHFSLDRVMFREELKTMHSWMETRLLLKQDYHEISYEQGHYFKQEKEYQTQQISIFIEKINHIINEFNVPTSLVVIPDKNMYKEKKNPFILDYHRLYEHLQLVEGNVSNMLEVFELSDYYKGDPHLKQEAYLKWLQKEPSSYIKQDYPSFYGSYQSQMLLTFSPDILSFYTNDTIDHSHVNHLEFANQHSVYDKEKLSQMDSYDVFLSGASSFIEITNPKSNNDKTLLIFRDSYGSSLAPLLIEDYRTIYLVDLRYISFLESMKRIKSPIDELLFFYGSRSVNQSMNMKW